MAFAFSITKQTVFGDQEIVMGTFTNGGSDTGGDIKTGLKVVNNIILQHTGSAVVADSPAVNETMPCGGDVTIVTTADGDGTFTAYGNR